MTQRTKNEEAIMSRIANLEMQLNRQRELLSEERMKRAGVAIGDIVTRRGFKYRVCDVEASWQTKAWVKGNPQRADGSYGTAVRNLFGDWEHLAKEPA